MATWAEALPLTGLGPRVSGVGQRSYRLESCSAVVSAGFAGACRKDLRVGDLLLSGTAPPELQDALQPVDGTLRTVDHVAGPAEKAQLGETGAAAVDMETAWIEAAARQLGILFLGVRVIIDLVHDRPLSAATAMHYPAAACRLRQVVRSVLKVWP